VRQERGITLLAISRVERSAERKVRVVAVFGEALAEPVLDLLELNEHAWHDRYGEIAPSETIVDDILFLSDGQLAKVIRAARLAVKDSRDLIVAAQSKRTGRDSQN
jgi:hypothetical protein